MTERVTVKKPKSAFLRWFRLQYGPAPSEKTVAEIDVEVRSLRSALWMAEQERERIRDYETRMDAALKGWVARERG